jgi:hypothetical protein
MPELDQLLATVSEGLKALAGGIEEIAQRIETLGDVKGKPTAGKKKAAKPAAVKRKKKRSTIKSKAASKKKAKPTTATNTVLAVISKAPKGIKTSDIKAKTGFDEKKVYNIVFKLKQQGKIKTIRRGVYVKG